MGRGEKNDVASGFSPFPPCAQVRMRRRQQQKQVNGAPSSPSSPSRRGRKSAEFLQRRWSAEPLARNRTEWTTAARQGDEEHLRHLLDGPSEEVSCALRTGDVMGRTPLHEACERGHDEVGRILLARGAPVDAADWRGQTPLHYAAERVYEPLVQILLSFHADARRTDHQGRSPLHLALAPRGCHRSGVVACVRLLVAAGADWKACDDTGMTCVDLLRCARDWPDLRTLARRGALSSIQVTVDHLRSQVEQLTWDDNNREHLWITYQLTGEDADAVISRSAVPTLIDLLSAPDIMGRTILHEAAQCGHADVVTFLVSHGAEAAARVDWRGQTPLHYAAVCGHENVVSSLMGLGQSVLDATDRQGRTALHCALLKKRLACARLLVQGGASVTQEEHVHGYTALHLAILAGDDGLDLVREIVASHRVDASKGVALGEVSFSRCVTPQKRHRCGVGAVRSTNPLGLSPLEVSIRWGSLNVISILLNTGIAPRAPLDSKRSLLMDAILRDAKDAQYENEEDVTTFLLRREDCDPMERDGTLRTPLHIVVSLLLEMANLQPMESPHILDVLFHIFKRLMEGGRVDILAHDANAISPLFLAARSTASIAPSIVRVLCTAMPAFHNQAHVTFSPLVAAAALGLPDSLHELLVWNGLQVDTPDASGCTALQAASFHGRLAITQMLVTIGKAKVGTDTSVSLSLLDPRPVYPSWFKVASRCKTPLLAALSTSSRGVNRTDRDAVATFLIEQGASVQDPSILFAACRAECWNAVHAILQRTPERMGVAIERATDTKAGHTLLHFAVQTAPINVVAQLLTHPSPVPVNTQNALHHTPLDIAARMGRVDIVALLISKDARKSSLQTFTGPPVLQELMSAALIVGGSANTTPLHVVVRRGQVDAARELLQTQHPVNETDSVQCTPLFYAAENNHDTLVRLLLDSGASCCVGRRPLREAARRGHLLAVEALLSASSGLDLDDHDNIGLGPCFSTYACPCMPRGEHASTAHTSQKRQQECPLCLRRWVKSIDQTHKNPFCVPLPPCPALLEAAAGGHDSVVEALLRGGANPGTEVRLTPERLSDTWKATPLPWGAVVTALHLALDNAPDACGHEDSPGGVKRCTRVATYKRTLALLLDDPRTDVNCPDPHLRLPLVLAAQKGYWDAVAAMTTRCELVMTAHPSSGATPLLFAAARGTETDVRRLLEHGARVDEPDLAGVTPLHLACRRGHAAIVNRLLTAGISRGTIDMNGKTAWHELAGARIGGSDKERLTIAQAMMASFGGNDLHSPDTISGRTALQESALCGRLDLVRFFASQRTNDSLEGAMILAASHGHEAVTLELLLLGCPDVGSSRASTLNTLLHHAARHNMSKLAQKVVEMGADPFKRDCYGVAPIDTASACGHATLMHQMSEEVDKHGDAKEFQTNPLGWLRTSAHAKPGWFRALMHSNTSSATLEEHHTEGESLFQLRGSIARAALETVPLSSVHPSPTVCAGLLRVAARDGCLGLVRVLVARGDEPMDEPDNLGVTPLVAAARNGRARVVEFLLKNGANVNAPSGDGHRPLMHALNGGHEDVAIQLLHHGAAVTEDPPPLYNVSMLSHPLHLPEHTTPLHMAAVRGYQTAVGLLLRGGARIDAVDAEGMTPLHWALSFGKVEVADLLLESERGRRPTEKEQVDSVETTPKTRCLLQIDSPSSQVAPSPSRLADAHMEFIALRERLTREIHSPTASLQRLCEGIVAQNIDTENAIDALAHADMYHQRDLRRYALLFIVIHYDALSNIHTLESKVSSAILREIEGKHKELTAEAP